MIDLFSKEAISDDETNLLLQYVFNLAEENIVVRDWEYLENNKIAESCKCLAVKISIKGDAQILLQLYRIEIILTTFLERLESFCKSKLITCYITSDNVYPNSYYNYYKITPDCEMIEVSEWLKDDSDGNGKIYFHDTPLKH